MQRPERRRSSRLFGLVEVNEPREVLKQFGRQLLLAQDAGRDREAKGWLKAVRRVLTPHIPRRAVVKLMNQVVEFGRADLATPPPLKLCTEIAQRLAQFSIVGNGCVLPNQPFDPL